MLEVDLHEVEVYDCILNEVCKIVVAYNHYVSTEDANEFTLILLDQKTVKDDFFFLFITNKPTTNYVDPIKDK